MNWRIELRPAAIADLDDAAAWYEVKRNGLGRDFVADVIVALSSLAMSPLVPRLRHRTAGIRWIYPKRFPYRIIYRVKADGILVLAILHAARSDSVWRRRK